MEQGIASSAGAYFEGSTLDEGSFSVYGAPRGEAELGAVEKAVDAEIARIAKDGVAEKELESAKNRFLRGMIFASDNQASMANLYGAALATGGTVEQIREWPGKIRAVTADQVRSVAGKYLGAGHPVTGYLLPAGEGRE